jgi:hypothetical protein
VLVICLLVILLAILLWLLVKAQNDRTRTVLQLLAHQTVENQKLRNQFLAPDVATLAGLNQATLPPESSPKIEDELDGFDLGEAINYEDALASRGYQLGNIGEDLEAQGWPSPIVRNTGDDPIASSS